MKYLLILIVLALAGGSIYAYNKNPQACTKLGNDVAAKWPAIQSDVVTIFTKTTADATDADAAAKSKTPGNTPEPAPALPNK